MRDLRSRRTVARSGQAVLLPRPAGRCRRAPTPRRELREPRQHHALDYGLDALLDTFDHLADAGISWVGAGVDEISARVPAVLEAAGLRVGVVALTDHPAAYAAGAGRPGVAFAELRHGTPTWLLDNIHRLDTDVVVVTPHWGPNMVTEPVRHVRATATSFRAVGATLVAGHSAHVFQGVADSIVYDLGDFIDDYATDPFLRNDLGLLFLATFDDCGLLRRLEAIPLGLDYCSTRLALPAEADWIGDRFRRACAAFGTEVEQRGDRLVIEFESPISRTANTTSDGAAR